MQSFYYNRKANGTTVPGILGLTASPVMKSDPKSVRKIEETLDAICRTPTKHRAELRLQVKLPVLSQIFYSSLLSSRTKTVGSLGSACGSLSIAYDPYVLALEKEYTEMSNRKLQKVLLNHKTWCQDQMKCFHGTSLKICAELAGWAA